MGKQYNDIRVWVKSLSVTCPVRKALPDCPINELRGVPLAERLALVDRMSKLHLQKLIQHHNKCLYARGREDTDLFLD